jgi:hypothetical protein
MKELVFRSSEHDWNCPKCHKQYSASTFRSLQRHCNRDHNVTLKIDTLENVNIKRTLKEHNNRKQNKKLYRLKSAERKTVSNNQIHKCRFKNFKGENCKLKVVGHYCCYYHQRKTNEYVQLHGIHTNSNQKTTIELKKSSLPDKFNKKNELTFASGNGVFTLKAVQKGDYITEYIGEKISFDQFENRDRLYFLSVPKSFGFAGLNGIRKPIENRGLGSFINQGYKSDAKKYKHFQNNVRFEFHADDHTAWIVASKFISAKSELFIDYGDEYNMR